MRDDVTFAPWARAAELDLADAREDRMILVPRVLAAILCLVVLLAIGLGYAYAGGGGTYVAQTGENRLYVYDEACPLGGWFATWKRARWIWHGKPIEACWRTVHGSDGAWYVTTIDADGDPGRVSVDLFIKERGL